MSLPPFAREYGLVLSASVIVLKVFLNFIPPRVRFIKKQSIIHLSPCFQTRKVYWISEGRRRTKGPKGTWSSVSSASDHRPKVVIKMSPSRYACFCHVRRWCLRDSMFIFLNIISGFILSHYLTIVFPLIQCIINVKSNHSVYNQTQIVGEKPIHYDTQLN